MPFSLEIDSNIPQGRGLGASASLATAIIRAFMISLMLNFRKKIYSFMPTFQKILLTENLLELMWQL